MQVKLNRIIFAILWVLSLVGISFFGGPVSYGIFALLTAVPVICLIYLLLVYFFFHIYQEIDSKHLVANHVTPFVFMLKNEYHFGFVSVRVRFYSSFSTIIGLDDGVEYEFLPGTGIRKDTRLNCKYRGEYEVGIKTVELQDFFRLFHISYKNKEPRRVVVRPDRVELHSLRAAELSGSVTRDSVINPVEPDVQVRKYELGDDIRRINWKATARSGELLIRGSIGEEHEGVGILIGTNRCSKESLEYIPIENKILESAVALTLFFAKKNVPVYSCYLSGGVNEIYVHDLPEFEAYYDRVSSAAFREDVTEDMLINEAYKRRAVFNCKTVFMILREISSATLELAGHLHENNTAVVIYLVRDEQPEGLPERKLPGVEIRLIPCDADLNEVM